MDEFLKTTGLVILGLLLIIGAAILAGLLVWILWPIAIPAILPGLVASGVIAGKLSLFQAICVSLLFSFLIKSTTTVNTKKD